MTPARAAAAAGGGAPRGFLRRALSRLGGDDARQEQARQLVADSSAAGCSRIDATQLRERVRIRGTISMVTINPRGVNRWLEAVLSDGTGEVTLIWMGRRLVRGIEAGRRLEVTGLVTLFEGKRAIYNPNYNLLG